MTTHDSRPEATQPPQPRSAASQRQDSGGAGAGYRAPQVVVLGSAVELVQGAGFTSFQDGRRFYRR
jgi:hypothetical protein